MKSFEVTDPLHSILVRGLAEFMTELANLIKQCEEARISFLDYKVPEDRSRLWCAIDGFIKASAEVTDKVGYMRDTGIALTHLTDLEDRSQVFQAPVVYKTKDNTPSQVWFKVHTGHNGKVSKDGDPSFSLTWTVKELADLQAEADGQSSAQPVDK